MCNPKAEIISIGTELLLGHIVNTNASFLAGRLASIGVTLYHESVVGDNHGRLADAIRRGLSRSDIVITTGGLGPTVDDITLEVISQVAGKKRHLDKRMLTGIAARFKRRGFAMPASNRKMAMIPEGGMAVVNEVGTAPGILLKSRGRMIIALPGPPRELEPMFMKDIVPYLKKTFSLSGTIVSRVIRTTSLPESRVNELVRDFLKMGGRTTVGIYARPGEVDIKIMAGENSQKAARAAIRRLEPRILRRLGDIVYGFDSDRLEDTVGRLLLKRHKRLAVAESCTGGLIASRITDVSGSSRYFDRGVVAYSNKAKTAELSVPEVLIKKHGSVSRPVAITMAKGVLKRSGADYGLSVTGIAGPTGGTAKKPVGLVFMALATKRKTICVKHRFTGSRADIKLRTSSAALDLLRKTLKEYGVRPRLC